MDQQAPAAIAVNAVGAPQAGLAATDMGADQALALEILAHVVRTGRLCRGGGDGHMVAADQPAGQGVQPVFREQGKGGLGKGLASAVLAH